VSAEQFWDSAADPVAQFSGPICSHMNAVHSDSTVSMIQHYVGVCVDSAKLLSLDRLGFNTECVVGDRKLNIRLAFPGPAENRTAIKERIMQMNDEAAAVSK
jgi:hypothetical protein